MNKIFLLINVSLWIDVLSAITINDDPIGWTVLGGRCQSHRACMDRYSHCSGGKCKCLPNYAVKDYSTCKGNINAACDCDHDCVKSENVGCVLNTCQNYTDFFRLSNAETKKLYRATQIGSRCETDQHCSDIPNAVCKSGKCGCARRHWQVSPYGDTCRPVTNATCDDDSDCYEKDTQCFLNICMLPADFFDESNSYNASIYVAKRNKDPCMTDHHCRNLSHTHCDAGICSCPPDSKDFYDNCRKILNVPCKDDNDCFFSDIKCFLNQCLYTKDFFVPSNAHNVSLYVAKGIYDACETDHHCRNIEHTHCSDGLCFCTDDLMFEFDSMECRKKINCSDDSDCLKSGTFCFLNSCLLPRDFFMYLNLKNSRLYVTKRVSGYCHSNYHCRNLKNTVCYKKTACTCLNGYEPKSDGCHKIINVCSNDSNCEPSGTKHLSNTSQDAHVFTDIDDYRLYIALRVNDSCDIKEQCRDLKNTWCYGQKCRCRPKYEYVSGECRGKIKCQDNSDCQGIKNFCILGSCQTPSQFFSKLNADSLRSYATEQIHDFCQSDYHCRNLNNTHCDDDTCACLPGYETVAGTCQKALNVICSDKSDCLLPRSHCFLNTCLYPEDFLAPSNGYDTSLYATKRLYEFCQTDHHCREIKNSFCSRRQCHCKDEHYAFDDGCQFIQSSRPSKEIFLTPVGLPYLPSGNQ